MGVRMLMGVRPEMITMCMGVESDQDNAVSPTLATLNKCVGLVPMLCPILSLTYDMVSLRLLRNTVSKEPQGVVDSSLPIRATMFSTAMAVVFAAFAAVWAGWDMARFAPTGFLFVILSFSAVRCSITMRIAYVHKKRAKAANREERQEAERMHARNAIEIRQKLEQDPNIDIDLAAVRALTQSQRRAQVAVVIQVAEVNNHDGQPSKPHQEEDDLD